MASRQEVEKFILDETDMCLPGSKNRQMYEEFFKKLSDDEFRELMQKCKDGYILPIVCPNLTGQDLDMKRWIEQARRLGYEFFQRIWMPPSKGKRGYLTPQKYMVMHTITRRQSQHLTKKMSASDDTDSVDLYTNQVTGDSKSSRLSYPELTTLRAMGLKASLVEQTKYRGGDERGFNAFNTSIDRTGSVSMDSIEKFSSGVKVAQTLYMLLNAAHLQNNFNEQGR
jgi:hypothetical protein